MMHSVQITDNNPALEDLELSWLISEFTSDNGVGALRSLHEAGDSIIAVAVITDKGVTIIGSGVMVAPGLLLTATHVLDELSRIDGSPVLFTFLPTGARAWLPRESSTVSGESAFGHDRKKVSDISLVSCTLNSMERDEFPLALTPMQVALPLIGERVWALGFRHQLIEDGAACVTPIVSSGLVTAAYPHGRGEHMPSPCLQVEMDVLSGMSGGPVVNAEGYLIGIVSSSFEGGPSFVTLIWDALRYNIKGTIPKLTLRKEVNLIYARHLGLAKIKGSVRRRAWGDVVFSLTDDEMKLFIDSSDHSLINHRKNALDNDRLEEFIENVGYEMEATADQAAINYLNGLSLMHMRECLVAADIPLECVECIHTFSVQGIDGLEDPEVLATEFLSDGVLQIEYYFNLRAVIFRFELPMQAYESSRLQFDKYFMAIEIEDGSAKMETMLRCHFKASLAYQQENGKFENAVITWLGVQRKDRQNGKGDRSIF